MAITSKGFAGGPMTDDDFGAIAARGAWVESAAALAVTQPNTGTRTVSIAAGNAIAHGVRAVNDAAISQALTAPGSGGQWYLLVLRRDWTSGVKTTTLQVLTGASTGATTTPTAIPTALPATFQSNPGGANTGATAQADQPLAWVWVSSATTTVTIFDARIIDQRNRILQAAGTTALATLALIATPAIGATMLCADGITYRWSAVPGSSPTTYAWRPWESDYATFTPAFDQINYTGVTARWRYSGGKVRVAFSGTVSATASGAIRMSYPVSPADNTVPIVHGGYFADSGATNFLPIAFIGWSGSAISFYALTSVNPARMQSIAGSAVSSGWIHSLAYEYDPA